MSSFLRRYLLSLVALAAVGCSGTPQTQIITPQCSGEHPFGACEAGSSCLGGTCLPTATLCSPVNLRGACVAGNTCFSGGCVPTVALCSGQNPAGPCETGSTCFGGVCKETASLCSTSNPTGQCSGGFICQQGVCGIAQMDPCGIHVYTAQPPIGVDTRGTVSADGLSFKDSNGNGALDRYEDWRLPEICRARDLVARMTVAEKIGLMSESGSIGSGTADGTISQGTKDVIQKGHVRQALIRLGSRTASELAGYLNNVQKLCEAEPLGIPFVITTDPSHGFGMSTSASGVQTVGLSSVVSPWPYPLGLGAANDLTLTRQYGDTVRKEFMAMGFRWQLGPMADLATEPRWARVQNVFGENAFHVANHVRACVQGFQGAGMPGGLKNGIAATMKHFPGAGADEDGKDSHSRPGKYNVYPGDAFTYHQIAFRAAIDVGVAAVMPCYSIFKDQLAYDPEQVGAAFSEGLITKYLKQELGFSGMVTSDWGTMSGTSWGVEMLTQPQRAAKFVKAGSHQLGSDSYALVQQAYDQGLLSEAEINGAAEKILEMSFRLGLFENPYVDAAAAATIVRSPENRTNGFIAQKKAMVLLKNREHSTTQSSGARYLPLDGARFTDRNSNGTPEVGEYIDDANGNGTIEIFYDGVTDDLAGSDYLDDVFGAYDYTSAADATRLPVVKAATPAQADIAVLRITARKGTYFGLDNGVPLSFDAPFPGIATDSGLAAAIKDRNKVIDLFRVRDGYKSSAGEPIAAANPKLKIVLIMHMDRPGIVKPFINGLNTLDELPGIEGSYPSVSDPLNIRVDGLGGVDAFLVEFGAVDRAVLDVLFNKNLPTTPAGYVYGLARLPIEIPSSDAEVDRQYEDLPADSWNPTYALGAGSTY